MARELTRDDLQVYAALRQPLIQWLLDAHGRAGLRTGLLGLAGVVVSTVSLEVFDVSSLVVLVHLVVPLAFDGLAARWALQRLGARAATPTQPFLSPGHALAYARAVIATLKGAGLRPGRELLPQNVLPYARTLGQYLRVSAPLTDQATPRWKRVVYFVMGIVPVLGLAVSAGLLWYVFGQPVLYAAIVLFDAYDWVGIGLLVAINLAQVRTTWRDLHRPVDAPWFVSWLVEPPRVTELIFWRVYKVYSLALAVFAAFVVAIAAGDVYQGHAAWRPSVDLQAYALALDARLSMIAGALLTLLAVLYAVLLAAPWHARRLVAEVQSLESLPPGARRLGA